jgi:hypothetical protein
MTAVQLALPGSSKQTFDVATWTFWATVAGAVITFLGVAVAVFVYKRSRRVEAASARISSRGRRDDLISQLSVVADANHLRLMRLEIDDFSEAERVPLLMAYYANPLTPLPDSRNLPPPIVVQHVIAELERRYPSALKDDAIRALGRFASDVARLDVDRWRIVDLILNRARAGEVVWANSIRNFLTERNNNIDLAPTFIQGLDRVSRDRKMPDAAVANILFGVLSAVSSALEPDELDYFGPAGIDLHTKDAILTALASLLSRRQLATLGTWDEDGMSVATDTCAAMVVSVAGLLSDVDDHCAMRTMQNIPAMLAVFRSGGHGSGVEAQLRAGLAHFRDRRPSSPYIAQIEAEVERLTAAPDL